MPNIQNIHAREIFDSRGFPTVEVEVTLDSNECGTGMVPSGASTGKREALELRDGGSRIFGKGVLNAVSNVNTTIKNAIEGSSFDTFEELDQALLDLDGTSNKSNLGANAILAVSLAFSKTLAQHQGVELYRFLNNNVSSSNELSLPVPMLNFINGGAHADNNVDIQEFMLVPIGATSFKDAILQSAEVFHTLKSLLKEKGLQTAVGDEGGFAPNLQSNQSAIEILCEAIDQAGFTAGKDFYVALDVASSEFYRDGKYHLTSENKQFTSEQFSEYLHSLANNFPILSIEDGMSEDDYKGWSILTELCNNKIQLVGDDLLVTDPKLLQEAIDSNIANSILIKLNQIGTLTETVKTILLAQKEQYGTIISHRSGETEDTYIADLAVGLGALQIKTGSLSRSDRIAKYNRLLRIEDFEKNVNYAGATAFKKYLNCK